MRKRQPRTAATITLKTYNNMAKIKAKEMEVGKCYRTQYCFFQLKEKREISDVMLSLQVSTMVHVNEVEIGIEENEGFSWEHDTEVEEVPQEVFDKLVETFWLHHMAVVTFVNTMVNTIHGSEFERLTTQAREKIAWLKEKKDAAKHGC